MRRRHLLALVILSVMVATVLAVGRPMGVWDALTLRTEQEERWANGRLRERESRSVWGDDIRVRETWFENGTRKSWSRMHIEPGPRVGRVHLKGWERDGQLTLCLVRVDGKIHDGVETIWKRASGGSDRVIAWQTRYADGVRVETRVATPWFTEREILQSVEPFE